MMLQIKNVILFGCLIFSLFLFLDAKAIKHTSRGRLKSGKNTNELAKKFADLPPEIQRKVQKMFNQMRKSGKIPNLQASANQSPYSFYPHRKSPYQLRDEGFYGRSSMHQQQQPMMAGPDPFYAMRGQEMDTRKIDKIFDKWNEEAAEKAQAEAQNGGGGGGMEGAGQILGMVMQFAPMLMG